MASGPITSGQIDGETMETVKDFIFLGSKISADGDWSHEIKRHLLPTVFKTRGKTDWWCSVKIKSPGKAEALGPEQTK